MPSIICLWKLYAFYQFFQEKEKKDEPNFEILSNPARVMKPQLKVMQMEEKGKYQPIKDIAIGGNLIISFILITPNEKSQ